MKKQYGVPALIGFAVGVACAGVWPVLAEEPVSEAPAATVVDIEVGGQDMRGNQVLYRAWSDGYVQIVSVVDLVNQTNPQNKAQR